MTDLSVGEAVNEQLDAMLAEARRTFTDAGSVIDGWLAAINACWGEGLAYPRMHLQDDPDNRLLKRAIVRVLTARRRRVAVVARAQVRKVQQATGGHQLAVDRSVATAAFHDRQRAHLRAPLHHFAALRGVTLGEALAIVEAVADRFHSEVVRLHVSDHAVVVYGTDGLQTVSSPRGERIVRCGGAEVARVTRPTSSAGRMVELTFYRASSKRSARKYSVTLPLNFNPETVELPKPKEPPATVDIAPASDLIAKFLLRFATGIPTTSRRAWLRVNLGRIVAHHCDAQGIRGAPTPGTPIPYGGSRVGEWCTRRRKWLVTPGVSFADIDLAGGTVTVQIAQGNGRRRVEMPIRHLISDFPSTSPAGQHINKIRRASDRGELYAAVLRDDDGLVKEIVTSSAIGALRHRLGMPAKGVDGNNPWEGFLERSIAETNGRKPEEAPARPQRPAPDYDSATKALMGGLF